MANWHPDAKRVVYPDSGPYVASGHKIVWHTTETKGLPAYSGTQPHMTFNPRTNELWQHQPLDRAAKALLHPEGTVETNHAHAYQVELICYSDEAVAKQVGGLGVNELTDADYERIAKLARWLERNAAVPRESSVDFVQYPQRVYPRLGAAKWLAYEGHCGHQHVPNNLHGDPSALLIEKVLAIVKEWTVSHLNAKGDRIESAISDPAAWAHNHPGAYQRGKVVVTPR